MGAHESHGRAHTLAVSASSARGVKERDALWARAGDESVCGRPPAQPRKQSPRLQASKEELTRDNLQPSRNMKASSTSLNDQFKVVRPGDAP
jgi:hypothetical protein